MIQIGPLQFTHKFDYCWRPSLFSLYFNTPCLENCASNRVPANPHVLEIIETAKNLSISGNLAQFLPNLLKTPKGPPTVMKENQGNVKNAIFNLGAPMNYAENCYRPSILNESEVSIPQENLSFIPIIVDSTPRDILLVENCEKIDDKMTKIQEKYVENSFKKEKSSISIPNVNIPLDFTPNYDSSSRIQHLQFLKNEKSLPASEKIQFGRERPNFENKRRERLRAFQSLPTSPNKFQNDSSRRLPF